MAVHSPDSDHRQSGNNGGQVAVRCFLECPENYPDPTSTVETRETHLSRVFLTDCFVYKLKKPLRYDFLDFTTLEARRRNCEIEVAINSELAPSIYQGVVTLADHSERGLNLQGQGRPVDYLVKMSRLPDDDNLESRLSRGEVIEAEVWQAAGRLARFYADRIVHGVVRVEEVMDKVADLMTELGELPVEVNDRAEALGGRLRELLSSQAGLLAERKQMDVHGDLRPEHVYLGDKPVFIDRLEFNAQLRLMDPLEELSFFAMECARLDAAWVGKTFLQVYREETGDRAPDVLVDIYTGYRALLWAVLSARHLGRGDHRKPWEAKTRDYLERGLRAVER